MSDEVISESFVVTNKYRARQADSFAFVGTAQTQWKPCPIKEIDGNGKPEFDIPLGYKTVQPYVEMLSKKELADAHMYLSSLASGGFAYSFCMLCGHPIKYEYPIQCDAKKYVMWVGTECVSNFMGAGYYTKAIKTFKENKIREQFRSWVEVAIADCNKHETNTGWLEFPYYRFRSQLYKIFNTRESKIHQTSSLRLLNLFKKARFLNIAIPEQIEKEIELRQRRHKTRE